MNPSTQDAGIDLELHLKKTGNKQVLANHSCEEYIGAASADSLTQVAVNACVSRDAPGAREVGSFEDRLLAELQSGETGSSANPGLVLARVAVVKVRLPGPSGKSRPRALLVEKTEVNNISVKPLAASTFAPPTGFNKVPKSPPPALTPDRVIGVSTAPGVSFRRSL
jgi:hypothetical protein